MARVGASILVAIIVLAGVTVLPSALRAQGPSGTPFAVGACLRVDGGDVVRVLEIEGSWVRTTEAQGPFGPIWLNTAVLHSAQSMGDVCTRPATVPAPRR